MGGRGVLQAGRPPIPLPTSWTEALRRVMAGTIAVSPAAIPTWT